MAASTSTGRASREPVYFEEPAFSRWLFGSSKAAWIWLIARLWLGWEWLQAGWSKVFGGNVLGFGYYLPAVGLAVSAFSGVGLVHPDHPHVPPAGALTSPRAHRVRPLVLEDQGR